MNASLDALLDEGIHKIHIDTLARNAAAQVFWAWIGRGTPLGPDALFDHHQRWWERLSAASKVRPPVAVEKRIAKDWFSLGIQDRIQGSA